MVFKIKKIIKMNKKSNKKIPLGAVLIHKNPLNITFSWVGGGDIGVFGTVNGDWSTNSRNSSIIEPIFHHFIVIQFIITTLFRICIEDKIIIIINHTPVVLWSSSGIELFEARNNAALDRAGDAKCFCWSINDSANTDASFSAFFQKQHFRRILKKNDCRNL